MEEEPQMPESVVFTDRYLTVAEANRRTYAKVAHDYVKNTFCVVDPQDQQQLDQHLRKALQLLGDLGRRPMTLDACGGAGNAALHMQALGCDVKLVDISPEMIELYKEACERAGYEAAAATGEIGDYLTNNDQRFDLIVFSSALHHLENPIGVLRLAQSRLTPHGIIATIFDPIRLPKLVRAMKLPLHWVKRAKCSPKLICTRAFPVAKRLLTGGDAYKERDKLEITEDNMGYLAEFHGGRGFDDRAFVREIEQTTPLRALAHDRFVGTCSTAERILIKAFRRPNQFKLLLQNTETR